jgi:hypothetical protein
MSGKYSTHVFPLVEVRMGRNFKILQCPALEAFVLCPKFVFMYVSHTPPKPCFLLFQPE